MDEQWLFVWRAGVVQGKEPVACRVYINAFGCVCPNKTYVRQHACKRPGHRPEEITSAISYVLNLPPFITKGVLLSPA